MDDLPAELMIDTGELRLGMYVFLDLNWMQHPFPVNRFKISSQDQIDQIKNLGLTSVKVLTARSDPGVFEPAAPPSEAIPAVKPNANSTSHAAVPSTSMAKQQPPKSAVRQALDKQNASLVRCERLFGEATAAWKQISTLSQQEPSMALAQSLLMVDGFLSELSGAQETSIRLLSETAGDSNALHALNVTVISLLLGRALKLDATALSDIGVGALLHDMGKQALPDRLRSRSDKFTAIEERTYREHVGLGLQAASRMGVSQGAQLVIAQHHESVDGKGYPKAIAGERMTAASKVVSLVNTYDNLCNPGNSAAAVTPHDALALMFAQLKPRFDMPCLTAFIRLMGVYPPGSVVQLSNESFALVDSVNTARPLKPTVLVYDPKVPRDEALLLDLQSAPALGIRRSMHARQLPRAALDYLCPRKRMTYFFENDRESTQTHGGSAWVIDRGDVEANGADQPKVVT